FYVIDDGAPEEESAAPETPEWTGTPDETQKVARDGGEAAQTIAEMKKTELEAAAAVTVVKETLYAPDGTKQRFFDTKTGEERDIGLRDVVLLLRGAKTQAEVFRQVFSEQGIDAYVEAGEGYFDTVEIETFMNLLRVIDNRRRDVPLISVMYAPIFDFSTEELMDVRLAFPKGAYHEAVFACAAADADAGADACTASPRLREKISAMLARLEGWRENAAFMPLDEFVWELMKESGYYTYAGALPGGGQRQANLRALADKALDFQSTHMKGLQGFITYAEHVKRRVDTAPAKLIGESEEVLRIMTIHKSKGLEFPVVIVAGLGKRFRSDSSRSVAIHKDIGLALRWTDPAEGLYRKTLLQSMIERKKAREDLAEEIRILYVACTRAMDRLILLGSIRGGTKNLGRPDMSIEGRSYMELLLPAVRDTKLRIEGLSKADLLRAAGRESSRDVYFSSLLAAEPEGCGPESGREIWRRLSFSYPYKDAASRKSKYAATEMADTSFASAADRLPPAAVPRFMEAETVLGAAEKGSILHKAMELLDFHAAAEQAGRTAYFSAFLRDLVERGLFTPAEAETVDTEKLRAFLRSDVGRRAAQAAELQKEAPFVLKKIQDGEEILVQGVIDCYFMESDGCVLLDYKSGHLYRAAGESREAAKARLAERYRPQLEIYGEALEKIKGIPVKAACLYLLGEGESLWMEPR
ncbi:MAG: PD-(D/E)XK nuclease family protein, partial [Clostridiales Family XIII bacterium]|nr:PD-(D/E)XK nuclease family protein [Clostridiales Family XIII bacterium]